MLHTTDQRRVTYPDGREDERCLSIIYLIAALWTSRLFVTPHRDVVFGHDTGTPVDVSFPDSVAKTRSRREHRPRLKNLGISYSIAGNVVKTMDGTRLGPFAEHRISSDHQSHRQVCLLLVTSING